MGRFAAVLKSKYAKKAKNAAQKKTAAAAASNLVNVRSQAAAKQQRFDKHSLKTLSQSDGGFADAFGVSIATPAKGGGGGGVKREGGQFETPQATKRGRGNDGSPISVNGVPQTPQAAIMASPAGTPYTKRSNRGKSEVVFNAELPAAASVSKERARDRRMYPLDAEIISGADWTVAPEDGRGADVQYRYMWAELADKADVLDAHAMALLAGVRDPTVAIRNIGRAADEQEPEEVEYSAVLVPSQEPVIIGGRVCVEGEGRINPGSVLLEGTRNLSDGKRIKLDLSKVGSFDVFPGQVIAVEGVHKTIATREGPSYQFAVSRVLEPSPLGNLQMPRFYVANLNDNMKSHAITVVAAAGPFSLNADLSFSPLHDLLQHVNETHPDVLILAGPFIDAERADVKNGKVPFDFASRFKALVKQIVHLLRFAPTRICLVPSNQDVQHHNVFPSPPFQLQRSDYMDVDENGDVAEPIGAQPWGVGDQVMLLSNPAVLRINEVTIGVNTTDIVRNLAGSDCGKASANGVKQDAYVKRAKYLLSQRSFYPLFPAPANDNVDTSSDHSEHIDFDHSPDVLLLPSKLKFCAKAATPQTLLVNPGFLAKGAGGGTFSRLTIHPMKAAQVRTDGKELGEQMAQDEDDVIDEHHICERTRVDIMRI
jgi:DNA polymerase alpha subunit B